jgi:hypothetical protein
MQKKYPRFFSSLRIALAVVFIAIVGAITGVLGGLISPQVFLPEDIVQLRPIIFEDKTAARVSEKETNITDIVQAVASSMGEVYRSAPKDIFPFAKDFLGYALVGSADGWILLPSSAKAVRTEDIRFIDSEKRIFTITTRISDTATGMQYAHVALPIDATLKPVQFNTTLDIGAGKRVTELVSARSGVSFDLMPLEYPPTQTMSDAIQSPVFLQKRFNAMQTFLREGMPFVTEKKEVIGISTAQGILPMAYVHNAFTHVLRSQKIQRPSLAIQYLDLSFLSTGPVLPQRGMIKNGAYIIAQKRQTPLSGPTEKVIFAHGDVITSVNNEPLDALKSLSEIIQQYKTGDVLTLEYIHAGEKKASQITLQ